MPGYLHHQGLFSPSYFDRVVRDTSIPQQRRTPDHVDDRLVRLLEIWNDVRPHLVEGVASRPRGNVGLPGDLRPLHNTQEAKSEHNLIERVLAEVLGYAVESQRSLAKPSGAGETIRPDLICFPNRSALDAAVKAAGRVKANPSAATFCRGAALIVEVKRFTKGVGADELGEDGPPTSKSSRRLASGEKGAAADIEQVATYLAECGKPWGLLTNGRSWRLMRAGNLHGHLRFDLVHFAEDIWRRSGPKRRFRDALTDEDRETLSLFFWLYGPAATAGGFLDEIARESEAETRRVRDVLRERAHSAVLIIARGFLAAPENQQPESPTQTQLDHLRELALIFLYRLLFVLKAEAQNLLPVVDENGAPTLYARYASIPRIFEGAQGIDPAERAHTSVAYRMLHDLFSLVDQGGQYDVPAYNGGLFDAQRHDELTKLRLHDDAVLAVLEALIYLDGKSRRPIPYADLDVRDLGDIYEGLLEQRLAFEGFGGELRLSMRSDRSARKGSGSFFTPNALVDHVVRETMRPLLDACGDDAEAVLALRVVDPAMGSGHFLVKVVDVMAWHLTLRCDPSDPDAPRDNGPAELAYWKRKVVESCVYGVDVNPMAVELAKVALWLYTAAKGKPLSFLDHHLKCGNGLVGARLQMLATPGLRAKKGKKHGSQWYSVVQNDDVLAEPASAKKSSRARVDDRQLHLAFPISATLFSGIAKSVRAVIARPSDAPSDVKAKSHAYAFEVERRLAAHRTLADLWCLQWFLGAPDIETIRAYEDPSGLYAMLKAVCGNSDDQLRSAQLENLSDHPLLKAVAAARDEGYGLRLLRFFHWELEFPEVAFDGVGHLKSSFGFDAVVGNPPWDKIKPAKRDFYGPFSAQVANTQGPTLDALIRRLETARPVLRDGWARYEATMLAYAHFLGDAGGYRHQVATVEGKRTGGDPDLFRYFVERAHQCLREDGRAGLVTPTTLWQADGCTGLRRLLFDKCTIDTIFTFENYRKWAFKIHSSFKFTTFILTRRAPDTRNPFPAAFMLRGPQVCEGRAPFRLVTLSSDAIRAASPVNLALLDLRHDLEARLAAKLHATLPALGDARSNWSARYGTDLHMTNDAGSFKTRAWLQNHAFARVLPVRRADGTWAQEVSHKLVTAGIPDDLPEGGEYWVAASEKFYKKRGFARRTGIIGGVSRSWFLPTNLEPDEEAAHRIFPGERYTALYEGRMIHNFDHAQKEYVRGEGRKAIWQGSAVEDKRLSPRVFCCMNEVGPPHPFRVAFCDVTGATNERTTLAAVLPAECPAGNKVPTLTPVDPAHTLRLTAVLGSFVWDALIRLRVSTTMNFTYLKQVPVPDASAIPPAEARQIDEIVVRLSCTTPELSALWTGVFPAVPWSYAAAERNLAKRALLRAELDAIVADLYGLTVPEYAYVLSTFPLLDRDQPALPGDKFLTEGDERSRGKPADRGVTWDELDDGSVVELQERSFVTRDLALQTYATRKLGHTITDLEAFYREEVGIDPMGPLSRFRIGDVRDLGERVERARRLNAVAYLPSTRGGDDEEDDE